MTQRTDNTTLDYGRERARMRIASKYIPLLATASVVVILYVYGCAAYGPRFASLRVLVDLFKDNAFLGVAAIGVTFVILSGGIDLSVGAIVAFTSILIAAFCEHHGVNCDYLRRSPDAAVAFYRYRHLATHHLHPLLAIGVSLVLGSLFGALQGCIIHFYRQPPFLVTLAGMFFARGMGFVIHPQSLGIKQPFYIAFLNDIKIPLVAGVDIPFTVMCLAVVFLVALFIAHDTSFGRAVYAIGDDEQSATLMGLPAGRTKIMVYTLAGFTSALAGVVYTFYMQSGDPASCIGFELDAIAAVVIGGTLLSGGVGFVGGTAMGVLILGLIQNLIIFNGKLNSWWTRIAVGLLVLVFIAIQNVVTAASRRTARTRP